MKLRKITSLSGANKFGDNWYFIRYGDYDTAEYKSTLKIIYKTYYVFNYYDLNYNQEGVGVKMLMEKEEIKKF